jgi:uncharacterized protein (TIGR00304 family)
MNKYRILSLICFISGIAFFAVGFYFGEIQGGIFVVFPFVAGSGIYALAGFILIFLAMLLFIFGSGNIKTEETYDETTKKSSVKGGGVVLIGPIPIVFGSNWKIAIVLMIIATILILVSFFAFKIL